MSRSQDSAAELLVADMIDEFRERLAHGETPDPDDYAARHPEFADLIRDVLSTLQITPSQPRMLGDFRIVREVGRGGMGVVYEARQISLDRRVALKVLPFAALSDSRLLLRFKNEARAAAALDHPHVVKVHAVGEERGVHFLAMQFIDGRPLSDLIRERQNLPLPASGRGQGGGVCDESAESADLPLPASGRGPGGGVNADTAPVARASTIHTKGDAAYFRQVAEWGAQAADALEHAHSMGVVHRDVKPGNLLLDKNGQIWVADFGLAKLAASDANVTMTGDTLGTLRYMSPEQAGAKHGLVDARTDVYALGATLYELLTLTPAVDGKDKAEILWKIAEAEPTALRNVNRSIPRDFETVVLKCLAKEPTERYASARELADDLRRYLRFVPPRARRVSRLHRARKWIARRPLIGALAFAVIIATSAAISLGFWAAYREETVRTTREREERQKFFALLEQVRQRRADPVAGWTSANLSDLKELSRSPTAKEHLHDLRTESAAALSALDLVPAGILAEGFQAYSVDFASDGRLAVAQWRATEQGVMEIRLYDSELRQFRTLSLAPDAEWDKWRRRAERSGGFRAVRFSPNGRWLAAGTNDGRLARWDMNDLDAEPKTWIAHRDDHPDFWQSEVRSIGFTTDDVLLSSSRKAIRGWAIATGTPNGLDVRDYQLPLDFHPGKGYLAVYWSNPPAPGVNVNRLLNVATGQIQAGDIPEAYGAGIAPGAGFLANAWSHSSFPYFRSINAAASANYLLAAGRTPTELGARYFHFDRSSSTLAIVEEHDRRLTLSDVASGLLVSESPLPSDAPRAAFAPDGRRLAVAGTHGVSIFDVARDIVETVAVANERLVQNLAATTDHSELVTTAWELNVPGALYRWRLPAFRPILVNSRAKGFQLVADFAPNNRTFVIGVDTEKKYTIETSDGAQFHSTKRIVPRFGPDGRLWILSEDGTLRVATPPNWEQRLVWNNDLASVGLGIVPKSLAVGSDCVLVGRRDGRLYRIDPTAGQTHSWPLFSSAITSLDIASAGDSAVAGTDRGELRFVNPRTGESVEIPNAHRQEVTSIAFGRNLLVTGSADRRVRLWTTDGRPIATFRMSGPVRKILLSADGTSLLVHVDGERAIRRWRLDRLFAEWRALGLGDDLPPI